MSATLSQRAKAPALPPEVEPKTANPPFRFDKSANLTPPAGLPAWRLQLVAFSALGLPLAYALAIAAILVSSLSFALAPTVQTGVVPDLLHSLVGMGGVIVAVLMLLPVLTVRQPGVDAAAVRAEDPGLKTFIDAVAATLNVPAPAKIYLTQCPAVQLHQPRRGSKPNIAGANLLIGLPMLSGLNIDRLGGLVAHELGHLACPAGQRERFFVLLVNQWLNDAAGVGRAKSSGLGKVKLVGQLLLRPVVKMADRIAAPVLAEVENHADWYQTQVSGSDSFKALADFQHLALRAWNELSAEYGHGDLREYPADVSATICERMTKSSADDSRYLREVMLEDSFCNSGIHPPSYSRIDFVENCADTEGVLLSDRPALSLLQHPSGSARAVTLAFLNKTLQLRVNENQLLSETAVVRQLEASRELTQVLEQYMLGFYHKRRFLPAADPAEALKVPAEKRVEQINTLCAEIRKASPEGRRALADFRDAITAKEAAERSAVEAEHEGKDVDSSAASKAQRAFKDANRELTDLESRFVDRLALGVAMALADAVLRDPREAQTLRAEISQLLAVQKALASQKKNLTELRMALVRGREWKRLNVGDDKAGYARPIAQSVERISRPLTKLPSPTSGSGLSVLAEIDQQVNGATDGAVVTTGMEFVRAVEQQYLKAFVRLAEIALQSELDHGIKLKLVG